MNLASLIISGFSFIAVVIIGYRSIKLGQRSTKASEDSAKASETAAKATEESSIASGRAAEATERSVVASERAASLAAQDARVRQIEAVLEVVLNMREMFNEQRARQQQGLPPLPPGMHTPEALARTALMRQLEVRLVPFDDKFGAATPTRLLTTTSLWGSTYLDGSIAELKAFLKEAVDPNE